MAAIDPALMEAAGFTGAQAQQSVGSAQAKGAINTNQLNLQGVQERQQISTGAEDRGMLRSSMTNTALGQQTADQANKQQLIDLGVNDTLANANINVMQELAQQQAQQEAAAQQRNIFDASLAMERKKLELEHPNAVIDWNAINNYTGGVSNGTAPIASNRGW